MAFGFIGLVSTTCGRSAGPHRITGIASRSPIIGNRLESYRSGQMILLPETQLRMQSALQKKQGELWRSSYVSSGARAISRNAKSLRTPGQSKTIIGLRTRSFVNGGTSPPGDFYFPFR